MFFGEGHLAVATVNRTVAMIRQQSVFELLQKELQKI